MLGTARAHRAITFMMITIFITIMAAQDWIKQVETAISGSVSGKKKITGGLATASLGATTAAPIDPSVGSK